MHIRRFVIVESPYAESAATPRLELNIQYARRCVKDCLLRGDAPFASHLLYTQDGVLFDRNKEERALGIDAGLFIGLRADATLVYTDLGISLGMRYGIDAAKNAGRLIEYRQLIGRDPGCSTIVNVWGN